MKNIFDAEGNGRYKAKFMQNNRTATKCEWTKIHSLLNLKQWHVMTILFLFYVKPTALVNSI